VAVPAACIPPSPSLRRRKKGRQSIRGPVSLVPKPANGCKLNPFCVHAAAVLNRVYILSTLIPMSESVDLPFKLKVDNLIDFSFYYRIESFRNKLECHRFTHNKSYG